MNFSLPGQAPKKIGIFFGFLGVGILFRFWTFFQSGLDWDESLYTLVSQSMLNGNLPYIEVWDNKPIGIYVLYVIAFSLFGKSIFAIRLLSCLAIATTCYVLYYLGRLFGKDVGKDGRAIGLFAALIYVASSLQNEGTAANTEIFFIPFVATAYYLIFLEWLQTNQNLKRKKWTFSIIGLLLGVAFIIKYIVIYDLIAILLLTILQPFFRSSFNGRQHFDNLIILTLLLFGFLLPFLLMASVFIFNGYFSDFFYANFTANKIRTIDRGFSATVVAKAFLSHLLSNFPLWLCFGLTYLTLISKFSRRILSIERTLLLLLLLWILIPLTGIFLTFRVRFYAHYFLPLLPPLSLVTAFFLTRVFWRQTFLKNLFPGRNNFNKGTGKQSKRLIATQNPISETHISSLESYQPCFLWLLVAILFIGFYATPDFRKSIRFFYFRYVKGVPDYQDKPAEVAKYLQLRVNPHEYIYIADYDPVVYFLSNTKIPTKYAYPFFLIGDNLPKVAGVNSIQELSSLMSKRPLYIVMSTISKEGKHNRLFYSELNHWLKRDYFLEKEDDEVKLYRRKSAENVHK
ncbi:ArnT family glycosyltransferase [Leptothermofonsia sp. ETS-13]|uniref:ArnT family glycosyltransferase n=1 Tax=Leptothermofonsia sp. ETS-13 TaxID=3035696 RepID=UPI003B9EA560